MIEIFKATVLQYGLIRKVAFTDAFNNYSFEEMTELVTKITIANEILSQCVR